MADKPILQVTATRRILKYAEGADPNKDEPIDVVEREELLVGQAALDELNRLGVNIPQGVRVDGTN